MHGIGVDLMYLSRIAPLRDQWDDPFFQKSFTSAEQNFCLHAKDPILAFAKAFAAKEAVYKSLGLPSDSVRLNQIEILRSEIGQPTAALLEPLCSRAAECGVRCIHLSLSYEHDAVIAFAVAEGEA